MLHRRQLIHSRLSWKESSSKKKQVVVALSGIPCPGDGSYQGIPAQVQIFKESYDPTARSRKMSFQSPKMSIVLEGANVSVLGSLAQLNGRKLSRGAGPSCSFSVTTCEGTSYEFTADNEAERLMWVTVLEFLSMFPYASVPEVPNCSPVFRQDLDPTDYSADTVWPVYILPEEVGSRCSIIGSHILTLQGRVTGTRHGKLEVYSPTDRSDPVVSWDHDKIRRTGKLGQLLFIEIGRRCQGGPGLMWMYTGSCSKTAYQMRDTLRRFLFEDTRRSSDQSPSSAATSPGIPTVPPPLPPLRRSHSIATPSPSRNVRSACGQLHHYHLLDPTTC